MKEAMVEYFEHMDQNCPLFQECLPLLLKEAGQSHRMTENGIDREVWKALKEDRIWDEAGLIMHIPRDLLLNIIGGVALDLLERPPPPNAVDRKPSYVTNTLQQIICIRWGSADADVEMVVPRTLLLGRNCARKKIARLRRRTHIESALLQDYLRINKICNFAQR